MSAERHWRLMGELNPEQVFGFIYEAIIGLTFNFH